MRRLRQFLTWLKKGTVCLGILLAAGCATREFLFQGPYIPVSPLPSEPIIDLHCHIAGTGSRESGCFVSTNLQKSFKFGIYLKSFGVTRKDLLEEGDGLVVKRLSERLAESRRVGRAVVLALDGVVDSRGQLDAAQTEVYVPNEFVARETAHYTNLLFGASINPYRRDALERLQWVHDHGAKLIKWLPSIQLIDPADERLAPFYGRMAELNLPLLVHVGQERSFTHADDSLADPERLRLPLKLGVTVIAAHVASTGEHAGERDIDRLGRLFAEYPNLYSEISSLTQLNKLGFLKEALLRPEFSGRLFYGTDYPLINTLLVSPFYFPLQLSWRQIRDIRSIRNPWDRDVELKHALGVPTQILTNANRIIR